MFLINKYDSVVHQTALSVSSFFTGLFISLCCCNPQETPNGVEGFCTQVSA